MFTNAECHRCHKPCHRFRYSLKFWGGKRMPLCKECSLELAGALLTEMLRPQLEEMQRILQQKAEAARRAAEAQNPLARLQRMAQENPQIADLLQRAQARGQAPPQPPPVQQQQDTLQIQFMCQCGGVLAKDIDLSQGPRAVQVRCPRCERETTIPVTPELIQRARSQGQ